MTKLYCGHIYKCEFIASKSRSKLIKVAITNEKCQLPRGKNNDNCVDKDANDFLLHQSKV